jgi:hypothetical protein
MLNLVNEDIVRKNIYIKIICVERVGQLRFEYSVHSEETRKVALLMKCEDSWSGKAKYITNKESVSKYV